MTIIAADFFHEPLVISLVLPSGVPCFEPYATPFFRSASGRSCSMTSGLMTVSTIYLILKRVPWFAW